MNKFNLTLLILIIIFSGCSKDKKEVSLIKETSQELEMITSYNEAYKALSEGDPYFAAKKFLEAELLYPQSTWAPRASLMASYSYYMQNYYTEATSNLDLDLEKDVKNYLEKIENKTSIVIAHRLNLIKDNDIIILLQNGEIIEKGTHSDLIQEKGSYFDIFTLNQNFFKN